MWSDSVLGDNTLHSHHALLVISHINSFPMCLFPHCIFFFLIILFFLIFLFIIFFLFIVTIRYPFTKKIMSNFFSFSFLENHNTKFLLWLHKRPAHPGWQRQLASATATSPVLICLHIPWRQGRLQVLLAGILLPISQWSPRKLGGHRHLFTPWHRPPLRQGIMHLAKRKYFTLLEYTCMLLKSIIHVLITYSIHIVNHNIP